MSRPPLMPLAQQSASAAPMPDAHWSLPAGQALRLPVGPGGRWLHARSGCLWLTRSVPVGAAEASLDVVLRAGEGLALPGGSEWVLEGWDSEAAAFDLLVPPRACATPPGWVSRVAAWARAWRQPSVPCPRGSPA